MIIDDVLKIAYEKQADYINYLKEGKKMIIKDQLEEGLDDLDKLNVLYEKDYISLELYMQIKDKIVDKMIESLQEKKDIN